MCISVFAYNYMLHMYDLITLEFEEVVKSMTCGKFYNNKLILDFDLEYYKLISTRGKINSICKRFLYR